MFDRVFAYYPRGSHTGGPEAVHQLVDSLRRQSVEAYVVPYPDTAHLPRVAAYDIYDCPEEAFPIDASGTAVVLPEVSFAPGVGLAKATPVCWWLSVDNAAVVRYEPGFQYQRPNLFTRERARHLRRRHRQRRILQAVLPRALHATQSHYAWAYLNIKYGIISSMLSDYTRAPEDTDGMHGPADTRSIAYNPKKGSALLEQIRSAANEDIDWRPIQGMSASQVFELLHGTSLYLDTGNHPGKDRLPREAALAGAVTLAVRRGSAAFDQDVPIPTSHKFNPGPDAVQHAVTMIEDVFADLEGARRAQASYRNTILREKAHFDAEVSALFIERAQPADRYRIA